MESLTNKLYTFENAYISNFNKAAFNLAKDFCFLKNIDFCSTYIVTSEVGLGKTYLLQALYHNLVNNSNDTSPYYVTCNNLTIKYQTSVRENAVNEFIESFHEHDILLLDDIHSLKNKERSQSIVTDLIEDKISKGQKVILSSTLDITLPDYGFNEKLQSLISGGIKCNIESINQIEKEAYLNSLIIKSGLHLDETTIKEVLSNSGNDIRSINGIAGTIIAQNKYNNNTSIM